MTTQSPELENLNQQSKGLLLGFLAFLWWGCFPLYWDQLRHVSAFEVLAHRIFWSLIFAALVLAVNRKIRKFLRYFLSYRIIARSFITSTLISFNWGLYIWAVTHGYVLQSSLGYFVNPLVNMLLGVICLGEKLSSLQKKAFISATLGCLSMIVYVGEMPWIGLALASTFAVYALLRKTSPVGSVEGFALETVILSPFALVYLAWLGTNDQLAFLHQDFTTDMLLVGAGSVTAVPLILFAQAARQIPLTMVGFLQYVSPTCQFFLALFFFHERFTWGHFLSFSLIWLGLGFFSIDLWRSGRKRGQATKVSQ